MAGTLHDITTIISRGQHNIHFMEINQESCHRLHIARSIRTGQSACEIKTTTISDKLPLPLPSCLPNKHAHFHITHTHNATVTCSSSFRSSRQSCSRVEPSSLLVEAPSLSRLWNLTAAYAPSTYNHTHTYTLFCHDYAKTTKIFPWPSLQSKMLFTKMCPPL